MYNSLILNGEVECINISKDFHKLCRTCLRQDGIINLFQLKHRSLLFRDIFTLLSLLEPDIEDGFPQRICKKCADLLMQFYGFKKMIDENKIILQIAASNFDLNDAAMHKMGSENPENFNFQYNDDDDDIICIDDVINRELGDEFDMKEEEIILEIEPDDVEKLVVEVEQLVEEVEQLMEAVEQPQFEEEVKQPQIFEQVKQPQFLKLVKQSQLLKQVTQSQLLKQVTQPQLLKQVKQPQLLKQVKQPQLLKQVTQTQLLKQVKQPQLLKQVKQSQLFKQVPQPQFFEEIEQFVEAVEQAVEEIETIEIEDDEYSCKYCQLKFNSRSEYKMHMKEEVRKKTKCPFCKCILHSSRFDDHLRLKHKKLPPLKCELCPKRFMSNSFYQTHLQGHKDGFFCEICGKKCFTARALSSHRSKHDRDETKKIHKCDHCNRIFRHAYLLRDHMFVHTGERPYLCSVCGASFTQQQRLHLHTLAKHTDRPFSCEMCSSKYPTNEKLQAHLRRHSANDNLCVICGKQFMTKSAMMTHMRYHEGVDQENRKPVRYYNGVVKKPKDRGVCQSCSKTYSMYMKANFQKHIRTHIGESAFLCLFCGEQFDEEIKYNEHSQLHAHEKLEKTYPCEVCNSLWPSKAVLRYHMRYHTGEKPFQCNFCGRNFHIKAHLTTHLKWHSGEKPFSCQYCGSCFGLKGNLEQHIKTHKGERNHMCNICGKSFYTGSSLRKHQQIHNKPNSRGIFCPSSVFVPNIKTKK